MTTPTIWFPDDSRAATLYREGRLTDVYLTDPGHGWQPSLRWRITCDHCGTDFTHSSHLRCYCSDQCRIAGTRTKTRARVAAHRASRRAQPASTELDTPPDNTNLNNIAL